MNGTYQSGVDEPKEEVPDGIECRAGNRCNVVVWCHTDSHHSEECELEQRKIHKVEVPKDLGSCPLKPHHCVHYDPRYCSMNSADGSSMTTCIHGDKTHCMF
jgi:hypothetical protein